MRRHAFPGLHAVPGLAAAAVLLAGCGGPEYHPVHGNVTLDGVPLPEAAVTFRPEIDDGQWGIGRTDTQGQYTIEMAEHAGLLAGKYQVAISTYVEGNDQPDPPLPTVPEKVPMRYNVRTTLEFEVKSGDNAADFNLESNGEIFDPKNR